MFYWIAYVFLKLLSKIFFPCRYEGLEHLPKKGSYLVASNHVSNLDPIILGLSVWRKFSYIAKESLFKKKLFRFIMHQVGAFPIKRDSSDFRAIREAFKRLKRGCPVILFPEGTRQGKNASRRALPGVGLIAVKSQLPVIPVFIRGSDQVLPPGKRVLKRHPVTVSFGKPLHFSKDQSYPDISRLIMENIYSLSL